MIHACYLAFLKACRPDLRSGAFWSRLRLVATPRMMAPTGTVLSIFRNFSEGYYFNGLKEI